MWAVLRRTGAGGIAMHMRGTPVDMQSYTSYTDLVGEIRTAFADILSRAAAEGVHPECLMLDPGIGFSKTAEQNLVLIRDLGRFRELERPVLLGPSRKSFIGKVVDEPDPRRRVFGTAAAVALGVAAGADVVRVHDVLEMRQAALVAAGIRDGALPPA
jgi:dihydropteroate synthase